MSEDRNISCAYCGFSLKYVAMSDKSDDVVLELMRDHERGCANNPLVVDNERLRKERSGYRIALSFYADDEDRYLKGEGEPYGSIPTEVGAVARRAREQHNAMLDLIGREYEVVYPISGSSLIATERIRQIVSEGWTAEHDDRHYEGNIALAGATYALHACSQIQSPDDIHGVPAEWPWDDKWWKPSISPIRNLVKAGALIAAEIDRLQRMQGGEGSK